MKIHTELMASQSDVNGAIRSITFARINLTDWTQALAISLGDFIRTKLGSVTTAANYHLGRVPYPQLLRRSVPTVDPLAKSNTTITYTTITYTRLINRNPHESPATCLRQEPVAQGSSRRQPRSSSTCMQQSVLTSDERECSAPTSRTTRTIARPPFPFPRPSWAAGCPGLRHRAFARLPD